MLYPKQLSYAMTRWWLVENEIIIVVIVATLIVASVSYLGQYFLPRPLRLHFITVALLTLAGIHAQQMAQHYWNQHVAMYDWNSSWNDESYKAAKWLALNVEEDARIGSWNAGVLGHYAKQPVSVIMTGI